MFLAIGTSLLAGHHIVSVQVAVSFAHALEQDIQVEALILHIQSQAIRIAGDGAADDGLVVSRDFVVMVYVLVFQIARIDRSSKLRAVFINPVGLLLRINKAFTYKSVNGINGRAFLVAYFPAGRRYALHVDDFILDIGEIGQHAQGEITP